MFANDGRLVFSTDITGVEMCRRHPVSAQYEEGSTRSTSERCISVSDVVVSAVPSQSYKNATSLIKPGAACVNVATDDNSQDDVKDRAGWFVRRLGSVTTLMLVLNALRLYRRPTINSLRLGLGYGDGMSSEKRRDFLVRAYFCSIKNVGFCEVSTGHFSLSILHLHHDAQLYEINTPFGDPSRSIHNIFIVLCGGAAGGSCPTAIPAATTTAKARQYFQLDPRLPI